MKRTTQAKTLGVILGAAVIAVAPLAEAQAYTPTPAAKALLGPDFRIIRSRGQVFPWPGSAEVPSEFAEHDHAFLVATAHPSAVLRADNREIAYAALVEDLRVVKRELDRR